MVKRSDELLRSKAAEMIAGGLPENEVAKACGKSRSWVQQIKRKPDFQNLVKEFESQRKIAIKAVIQEAQEETQEELLEFRQQLVVANRLIFSTGAILLKKVREKAEQLQMDDISPSKISQSLKNAADSINIGLQIGQAAIGIDGLLEEINEFKTSSLKGYEATNGYQSISTTSNRN